MRVALEQARKAVASGDVPVGAAIFNASGELISTGHNERELHNDPTAHAEVVAIRRAAEKLGDWHLTDHTLVVTLEPCAMCAGAITQSRFTRVVFGAFDEKAGAAGSVWDLIRDPRLPNKIEVITGLLADESAQLLKDFFIKRR